MIGRIFVATQTISCMFEGEQIVVGKGDTAREGHPILDRFGEYFTPQKVKFEHLPAPAKKAAPAPPKK